MKRLLREIAYDLREPGFHLWIILPAALLFLLVAQLIQQALDASGRINVLTLALLEALIPTLGGYGAVMLMQGLLDTEGGEIAFTYKRSLLYWGLIRQLRFFILFALLVAMVCAGVASIMRINFPQLFALTLAQSFAVMGIAFLGITMSRKTEIGLIVLIAFVTIQMSLGREYPVVNQIYVLDGAVPSIEQSSFIVYKSVPIGAFGWGIGQVWLRP
ncbi:MAG: hypothetical protein GX540_07570 [Clostridiales bacterium]|nr:hypothetical protein [Clostridiales bacterium]